MSEAGSIYRPELIIGLVGPLGSNRREVRRLVDTALVGLEYETRVVKVSTSFRTLPHRIWNELPDPDDPKGPRIPEDLRYKLLMTAGDALREISDDKAAGAAVASRQINQLRPTASQQVKPKGLAFIIDSLKTPQEVEWLRRVYGRSFFAIGIHAPRLKRLAQVADSIKDSRNSTQVSQWQSVAEYLVHRDERGHETNVYGQDTAEAFPLADFICEGFAPNLAEAIQRFFDLVFGSPYITPSRGELAMSIAQTASRRSAAMSRQIGAAVVREGSILSIGCNEVPAPFGGQYWPGGRDARDFQIGYDPSHRYKRTILKNTIENLMDAGWRPADWDQTADPTLATGLRRAFVDQQVDRLWEARSESKATELRRSLILADLVDLNRTVHAEMAALMDCALRGVSVDQAVLYSTTFPCHECARHIVAAGIRCVYYLEPYPKSLVAEYFSDSITIDGPETDWEDDTTRSGTRADQVDRVQFRSFRGVAPPRFHELFRAQARKDDRTGDKIQWQRANGLPRDDVVHGPDSDLEAIRRRAVATVAREEEEVTRFLSKLASALDDPNKKDRIDEIGKEMAELQTEEP